MAAVSCGRVVSKVRVRGAPNARAGLPAPATMSHRKCLCCNAIRPNEALLLVTAALTEAEPPHPPHSMTRSPSLRSHRLTVTGTFQPLGHAGCAGEPAGTAYVHHKPGRRGAGANSGAKAAAARGRSPGLRSYRSPLR